MERKYALPFFLRIKNVSHHEDTAAPPPQRKPPDFHWWPTPQDTFTEDSIPFGWCEWDPNLQGPRWRLVDNDSEAVVRVYRTCTMMWLPERHYFLHIPIDRTTTEETPANPSESDAEIHTWRRLYFGYHENQGREDIALIGPYRENEWLHVPGPRYWFDKLLPITYQSQNDGPQVCRLAGDLSILIGLIAFSAQPRSEMRALVQSFRPDLDSTTFTEHDEPPPSQYNYLISFVNDRFPACRADESLQGMKDALWSLRLGMTKRRSTPMTYVPGRKACMERSSVNLERTYIRYCHSWHVDDRKIYQIPTSSQDETRILGQGYVESTIEAHLVEQARGGLIFGYHWAVFSVVHLGSGRLSSGLTASLPLPISPTDGTLRRQYFMTLTTFSFIRNLCSIERAPIID